MSNLDRERWEAKYSAAGPTTDRGRPQSSLAWLPAADNGQWALDLACGRGRHSHALAALGYTVVAADIAVAALRPLAAEHGSTPKRIYPVQVDLDRWAFSDSAFDLIIQYDFLERRLFPQLMSAVKPGGLLLIDTFRISEDQAEKRGPNNPKYRLKPRELEAVFKGWDILRRSEQEADDSRAARAAILVRRSSERF